MLQTVKTNKAPEAIGPYSQAKIYNDLLFTSGQIPIDPKNGEIVEGGIVEQTTQVMKNLSAVLEEANTNFSNVIKTTCFLADMDDFSEFNNVYEKYFVGKPARSCVAVKKLPKGVLCEVELIASINIEKK